MLYIGTSGFSYDDWKGRFYPPNLPKQKMFDYYSHRFNAVEINATFYHIYTPAMMRSLVRRSEGRIMFTAKMSAVVTHERILNRAVQLTYSLGIEPAAEAGVLGAVLLQFPYRFHFDSECRRYLDAVLGAFDHFPLVVEIRHRSWQTPEAKSYLRDRGVNLCIMDMPRRRGLPTPSSELIGAIPYIRFHGRNGTHWFQDSYPGAPYDYNYPAEELESWVEPIKNIQRKAQTAFVFFNNHVQAQAAQNAREFMRLMGERPPTEPYADLFSSMRYEDPAAVQWRSVSSS